MTTSTQPPHPPVLDTLTLTEIRQHYINQPQRLTPDVLTQLQYDRRQGVRALYTRCQRLITQHQRAQAQKHQLLTIERDLWHRGIRAIAGVDEVGMGALAGPVVAAAVILDSSTQADGINDSKQLTPKRREDLAEQIKHTALAWAVGRAEIEEIAEINIYRAGLLAMRRAVAALTVDPEYVLVDARRIPRLTVPQQAISQGDCQCYSIAAASIIAKVHRDALLCELDDIYPEYGFSRHKGYTTQIHVEALKTHGPSPVHRLSYRFVQQFSRWPVSTGQSSLPE